MTNILLGCFENGDLEVKIASRVFLKTDKDTFKCVKSNKKYGAYRYSNTSK